jgi:hypothetical protein
VRRTESIPSFRRIDLYGQLRSNPRLSVLLLLSLLHHAGVSLERNQVSKLTSPPAENLLRWVFYFPSL